MFQERPILSKSLYFIELDLFNQVDGGIALDLVIKNRAGVKIPRPIFWQLRTDG